MTSEKTIIRQLRGFADSKKAEIYPRFFKTGKGEYGEGDVFIGVTVPNCRKVSDTYYHVPLITIQKLLASKIHEVRLVALLILVKKFSKASIIEKQNIYNFYIKNTKFINNWDLVDLSSSKIVGEYLLDKSNKVLLKMAKSKNVWERRIAIVSTFTFIKKGKLDETLIISKMLLGDKHDLVNKAVGWMLRELGKKNEAKLVNFLKENYSDIPRTTLRYAIERFPNRKRVRFLRGSFEEVV